MGLQIKFMQSLRVSLVQTNLYWENKTKNLAHFTSLLSNIENTDLIILPEMFTTAFTMNANSLAESIEGDTVKWIKQISQNKKCAVVGSFICKESGNFYNRLVWADKYGNVSTYDKRHLFRFAGENEFYTAGKEKLIVELNGWKICPLVCFDLRFPVFSRNTLVNNSPEYDILIYIANWPKSRSSAWKTLLEARAHENQCYTIGVNRIGIDGKGNEYSGDSAVINFKGEKISTILPSEEKIETITFNYSDLLDFRQKFPVLLDADNFKILD